MSAHSTNISSRIERLPLGGRTVDEIFSIIRQEIEKDPSAIREILPDMDLKNRLLTADEAKKLRAAGSAAHNQEMASKIRAVVVPAIREILRLNPGATITQIARELDIQGIKPPRAPKWNRKTVSNILEEEGLRE